MSEKLVSETIEFTKEEMDRILKVAKTQNVSVDHFIRVATQDLLENLDPDLSTWKIPHSLFATLVIPEVVRRKLEMWQRCKEEIQVSVDARGLTLLNATGLDEFTKSKGRFILVKMGKNLESDEKGPPDFPPGEDEPAEEEKP